MATPDPASIAPPACPPPLLASRLAVQMFLAYAVQGAWVPVFSVYLHQIDFTPAAVSWAFTAYSLSALVAPLAWGQVADRWVPAERCISVCALACAVMLALMPHAGGAAAMFLANVGFWLFMIPVNSLGTALALRQLPHPERSFGPVRVWGTVGWAAAGLLVSAWLRGLKPALLGPSAADGTGPALADAFAVGAVFAAVLSVYSLTLPATPPCPRPAAALPPLRRLIDAPLRSLRLLRRRAFLVYAVCLFGFYLTMPFTQQMTPLLLESLGVDRAALPMAMTVCQTTEVVTLALLPWLLGRLGVKATMGLGAAAWTVGMASYAIGRPVALVVGGMAMHGLFICCFLVAGQVFVNRVSAQDVRASAQGLLVLFGGVGLLAGHALVAAVRQWTGDDYPLSFLPAAAIAAVLVTLFLTGFTTRVRPAGDAAPLASSQEMT